MHDVSALLEVLAAKILCAKTEAGARVVDISDASAWLRGLSKKAARVESIDQLFEGNPYDTADQI